MLTGHRSIHLAHGLSVARPTTPAERTSGRTESRQAFWVEYSNGDRPLRHDIRRDLEGPLEVGYGTLVPQRAQCIAERCETGGFPVLSLAQEAYR
jgi:hypothetical protein